MEKNKMKDLSKKAHEFLDKVADIRQYWLREGINTKDTVDGVIHSILAYIDGLGENNQIIMTTKGHKVPINENDWLAYMYFRVLEERDIK